MGFVSIREKMIVLQVRSYSGKYISPVFIKEKKFFFPELQTNYSIIMYDFLFRMLL